MEKDPKTAEIIGAAIEVHRVLGPGLLESIYEEALCHELLLRGMTLERQKPVDVVYKDKVLKGQRIDLLVNGMVVVEVKATSRMHELYEAQLLSYLRTTGLRRGLLLNFGMKTLTEGLKRMVL